jgi:hypothetical protein
MCGMARRAAIFSIGIALLTVAPCVSSETHTLYRWVDETGGVHFTQGLAEVPARFRRSAVPLGAVGAPPPPSVVAPPREPPPAAVSPSPAPPALPARKPPPPGDPERNAVDDILFKARTTPEYLAAAEGYARLGLPLGAKTALQKAADAAKTSAHWKAVAKGYNLIGETKAAGEAGRKAEGLAEWERRYFGR